MTTSYIADKDGNSIETSKATSKPSDRHFRNAWTLSGTVISEDMTTAKTIFKNKIREVRKPLLEAEDDRAWEFVSVSHRISYFLCQNG